MTDTITETTVTETVEALQRRLADIAEQREQERVRHDETLQRVTERAHRDGDANSIGRALDDMLEEVGLPRRPRRVALWAQIRMHMAAHTEMSQRVSVGRSGPHSIRISETTGVSIPTTLDLRGVIEEGEHCICHKAPDIVNKFLADSWADTYYRGGDGAFEIGKHGCDGDRCVNRDVRRNYSEEMALGDPSTMHRFVPNPPPPTARTHEPF
jgi:hypothetical protein